MVVSHVALEHPDRVTGLVNMSVPHVPRGEVSPITMMRNVIGDNFFYILYFQERGVADAELGGDPARTMRRMLAGLSVGTGDGMPDPSAFANDGRGFVDRMPEPASLPDWLAQDELDRYVAEFARTGFTGGINWYRNFDRNWAATEHLAGAKVDRPSLFIGGSRDPVLMMTPPAVAHGALTDHRGDVILDGPGHWVQQEAPDAVNAALIDFLAQLYK
jgi:pimeloyl-ACP methyl ester carboxylesterase